MANIGSRLTILSTGFFVTIIPSVMMSTDSSTGNTLISIVAQLGSVSLGVGGISGAIRNNVRHLYPGMIIQIAFIGTIFVVVATEDIIKKLKNNGILRFFFT